MSDKLPFTNIHAHVFNDECAPDNFLMIIPSSVVRKFPKTIRLMLRNRAFRKLNTAYVNLFFKKTSPKHNSFNKYMSFLYIALQRTQLDVFEKAMEAGKQYDAAIRIVGLTLNMDYMDNRSSKHQVSYETQLEGVKRIKRYYPRHFFPFLCVDPRHKAGNELVTWAKPYFETGVLSQEVAYPYFSGVKLYPALGFFPFDPRLDAFYAYAEANQLPVITHVTRSGSLYIGQQVQSLIPQKPEFINTTIPNPRIDAVKLSVTKRIAIYYNKQWVKNSDKGNNDLACDLFTHPENYIPVLEKYPNLKICLAHMGGSSEIAPGEFPSKELDDIRQVDTSNWFELIRQLMIDYPNLYTDISYALSDLKTDAVRNNMVDFLNTPDKNGNKLLHRVLFGTDFFMTEQEAPEAELYRLTSEKLAPYLDQIARINTQEFLQQPV